MLNQMVDKGASRQPWQAVAWQTVRCFVKVVSPQAWAGDVVFFFSASEVSADGSRYQSYNHLTAENSSGLESDVMYQVPSKLSDLWEFEEKL